MDYCGFRGMGGRLGDQSGWFRAGSFKVSGPLPYFSTSLSRGPLPQSLPASSPRPPSWLPFPLHDLCWFMCWFLWLVHDLELACSCSMMTKMRYNLPLLTRFSVLVVWISELLVGRLPDRQFRFSNSKLIPIWWFWFHVQASVEAYFSDLNFCEVFLWGIF